MAKQLGAFAPLLTDEERNARVVVRGRHASDDFRAVWSKLSKALEDHHNVAADKIAGRIRRVSVPFSRVTLVSKRAAADLARGVQDQMEEKWGDLIHKDDFMVEAVDEPQGTAGGQLLSYFGFGVWVPNPRLNRIVGEFRVRAPGDGGAGVEPLLPDGRRAAWWDKQTGLAFSFGGDEALARVCLPGVDCPGVFYFGKTEEHRDPSFVWLGPDTPGSRHGFSAAADWWRREGEWLPVRTEGRSRSPAFEVLFSTDRSPRRLLRRAPRGAPYLMVAGVYLPEPGAAAKVAHAWLEAQSDGAPVHSALMPRSRALIFDSGSRYALFERERTNQWLFEKGDDHDFLLSNIGAGAGSDDPMSVKLYSPNDREDGAASSIGSVSYDFQLVLAKNDDRPFGYIALEPFDAGARDYRVVAEPARDSSEISLRWLDETATVVARDALRRTHREGLARWALRHGAVDLTVDEKSSWMRAGGREFPPVDHGQVFALGPLLVALFPPS